MPIRKQIKDIQYRANDDGTFSEVHAVPSFVFKYSFKERLIIRIDYLRFIKFSKEFRSIETKLSFGRFGCPTIFFKNKDNTKFGSTSDFFDIEEVIKLLEERGWL